MERVFRAMWVVAYRELLRFLSERTRIFSSFAMPILFLVIFGAGFGKLIGALTPGVNFIQFMYPGIIAMTVLTNSLMSGLSIVWDREFGFLKEILVAPLARPGIVLGKAVGSATVAVGQGIVMLILAPFLGVSLTPLLVLELIPILIIISVSLSGLGVLMASRMRSQQGFQIVMQVVIFPLIFLSGVFFPLNGVPTWLQFLSKINPLSYGVDAIRQLFLGGKTPASIPGIPASPLGLTVLGHTMTMFQDMVVITALGVVLMAAAAWSFSKQD
jgi:ABC-2 type transport system permease protein